MTMTISAQVAIMFAVFCVFVASVRLYGHQLQMLIYRFVKDDHSEHDESVVYLIYSAVMLVGTFVHEASHWVMAILLGAGAGNLSLIPRANSDGTIRLGYAEVGETGVIRSSVIGAAPLLVGISLVYVIGEKMGVYELWGMVVSGQHALLWHVLRGYFNNPYFWVGVYFVFQISSGMLPSRSDRKDWLPAILLLAVVGGALYFLLQGTDVTEELSVFLHDMMYRVTALVTMALLFSTVLHLVLTLFVFIVNTALKLPAKARLQAYGK